MNTFSAWFSVPRQGLFHVVIAACCLASTSQSQAESDRARKLSAVLKPAPRSEKGTKSDIDAPKKVTITILEQLQASDRSNGPSAESLIVSAFEMRDDVGDQEAMLTANALINNFHEAEALGLFNDNNKFNPAITRGPDTGKNAVIEYIILPSHLPEMSKHPANLRIVAPSKKRSDDGAALTDRENAYLQQFQLMIANDQSRDQLRKMENGANFAAAGLTTKEEHEKWLYDMEAAGDAAKAAPSISLRARKGASPSHMSGNRWRIDAEVVNGSSHPTEIRLEYWLIGITDRGNKHYVMKHEEKTLELLAGQTKSLELWTDPESSYVKKVIQLDGPPEKVKVKSNKGSKGKGKTKTLPTEIIFRGFLLRAVHKTGEVAILAPDQNLLQYLDADGDKSIGSLK